MFFLCGNAAILDFCNKVMELLFVRQLGQPHGGKGNIHLNFALSGRTILIAFYYNVPTLEARLIGFSLMCSMLQSSFSSIHCFLTRSTPSSFTESSGCSAQK